MGIANFGSFAGGLMRGHLAATEEQRREQEEARRKEDQAFQNEQRALFREEEGRKKRVREGIAGLARPGQETGRTPYMMPGLDGPEALPGAFNVARQTDEGYQRGMADVFSREGMFDQAAAAEDRVQTLRDRARTNRLNERTDRQMSAVDAALTKRQQMITDYQKDPQAFISNYANLFNTDQFGGPQHAGATVALASTPQGTMAHYMGADGRHVGSKLLNPQTVMEMINNLTDAELGSASPEMYGAAQARGIQRGQLEVAQRNAASNEAYRTWLQGRPTLTQDGSGRILVTDNGGNLLRTLGAPRPSPADRSPKELPPAMVKELNDAAQAVDDAKTPQERQAAQQRYNNKVALAATYMGKVLKPGEVRGNYPGSADADPEIAMLNTQAQQLLSKMTGDNYEATQAALERIGKQKEFVVLRRQITELAPEERIPQAHQLLKQKAEPETLQRLGFTPEEIRKARRYTPATQTPSGSKAGGSATDQPKPAEVSGDKRVSSLSAEEAAMPVSQRLDLGLTRARTSSTGTDTRSVNERLFGQ